MSKPELSSTADSTLEAVARVRSGATRFTTNCFASEAQLASWSHAGHLRLIQDADWAMIVRRDASIERIYHAAASMDALGRGLAAVAALESERPLVADLIGRPDAVGQMEEVYRTAGFREYDQLSRMVLVVSQLSEGPPRSSDSAGIEVGAEPDAVPVLVFLRRLLDPLVDQIPSIEEIELSIGRAQVLIARNAGEIAGVLIFDRLGQSATLRYWWVDPDHRDRGYGARLIRGMFDRCRDASRIMLWVVSDNADAIRKYEHYGFRLEGLVDRIMTRNEGLDARHR